MRNFPVLFVSCLSALACNAEEPAPKVQKVTKNRLANEKSPYLRQHATNPVDWYPWGEEAFEKARREQKPIFLSIGYSSCHWCHVMEHESFADEEVAKVLNEHFVCIKVDREERPDVDEVYMTAATYVMRRQGGWPLSIWMTPERKPFAAGTYFPKEPRMGMPGFLQVLGQIVEHWSDPETRKKIRESGDQVAGLVQQVYDMEDPDEIGADALDSARQMAEMAFDREMKGFGSAPDYQPKFPSPSSLEMLLRRALRKGDGAARDMVTGTLDAMAKGGIHDHVGGGFHRYSVTRDWLVPHFEKMLYDNAQLLGLYAWAHLVTGDELYRETAADIARWVQREMTDEEGGFFSAQDADDPGGPEGEGGFYVWDPKEIEDLLPADQAKVVLLRFGIKPGGNWEEKPGKSILQVEKDIAGVEAKDALAAALARMYEEREKRPKPMTDRKVLAGWNGLMVSGFCRAYQAFGEKAYLDSAVRAGGFLRTQMTTDGRLRRRWMEDEAAHDAVLEDYAYVVAAYLDLYETTFDPLWIEEALRLNAKAVELFHDPEQGGFFFTAKDGEKLIARGKPGFDNAQPSGNGVMALNLLRIADLKGTLEEREMAGKTLEYFGARVSQSALGFSAILNALDYKLAGAREIFIAGPADDPGTRALVEAVWRNPDPNRVVALVRPGLERLLPLAEGKTPVDGKPAAYVCRNFTCDAPTTNPDDLR